MSPLLDIRSYELQPGTAVGRSMAVLAVVAAGLVVGLAAAAIALSIANDSDPYDLEVGAGLSTRLSETEVAEIARDRLRGMAAEADRTDAPDVIKITAIRARDIPSLASGIGELQDGDLDRVEWFVRARGWFVARFSPRGVAPYEGPSGYVRIDDATGLVVGMGIDPPADAGS